CLASGFAAHKPVRQEGGIPQGAAPGGQSERGRRDVGGRELAADRDGDRADGGRLISARRYLLVLGGLLLAAVGLGFGRASFFGRAWSTTLPLPLVQYIARPDDFSGHVLALQGYLVTDGAKGELFLSEADAANGLVANGVAIDFAGARVPLGRVGELDHRF